MVTGGSCGARPPSCSVVRVAPARRCGFAGAGPAAVARIAPPFPLRGGRPPGPGGAEGRACGSPAAVGAGGGGWGGRPLARPRVCAGGGGWVVGGPLAPWRCLSSAVGGGGGGGMAALVPGASHRPGGRALRPPPLSRAVWKDLYKSNCEKNIWLIWLRARISGNWRFQVNDRNATDLR